MEREDVRLSGTGDKLDRAKRGRDGRGVPSLFLCLAVCAQQCPQGGSVARAHAVVDDDVEGRVDERQDVQQPDSRKVQVVLSPVATTKCNTMKPSKKEKTY